MKQFQLKIPVVRHDHNWKVCISEPFLNCEKIYPIQQRKVDELIKVLKSDDNVKNIIIFGSSVDNRCHTGSDVDAYVTLLSRYKTKKPCLSFECDFWTNDTADRRMQDEIQKKGVLVYEK